MHDKMKTEACRLAVRVYLAFMPSCTHLPLHVEHTRTENIYNDPGHATTYEQYLSDCYLILNVTSKIICLGLVLVHPLSRLILV